MAKNEDLYCMICTSAPCACKSARGATPKKARPKPAASPVAPVEPEQVPSPPVAARPSFVDRMRAEANRQEQEAKRKAREAALNPQRKTPSRFNEMTDSDAATLAAVRALSEVFEIHPDDLAPFRDRLAQPPTVEERAGAWRYRRNGLGNTGQAASTGTEEAPEGAE